MDTAVIKILIGCSTAIALTAILCDYFVEKETTDESEEMLSKKIIKIHRNYIAGILGFAIIMLLTAEYGGTCEQLFKYLSFGSTITSLVLSILAIFVTVRSSFDLYKQYGTIKSVSEQISESLRRLQTTEIQIGNTSSDISSQMNTIVDEIEKRFNTRIEQNEKKITDILNDNFSNFSTLDDNQDENDTQIDKRSFISDTSRYGIYALYACVLSKEKNKLFELSQFFTNSSGEYYAYGYLVSLRSAGILYFKHMSSSYILCKESLFTKEEIVYGIKIKVEEIRGTESHKRNLEIINAISDYFEEPRLEL